MVPALILLGILVAIGAWLVWPRDDAPEPTAHRHVHEDIDYSELEQAEREVQEAPDEDSVRDWGPGAQKPPIA